MKYQMQKTLCETLGLDFFSKLTCKTIFENETLSGLTVSDSVKTYTLYSNTAPFAIAKSIFNVNERIRSSKFSYSIPALLSAAV